VRTALVLFGFGLCLRTLFWLATPDRGAAWNLCFQGDAPVWQDLAQKVALGQTDELLRLPLRPPGMHWLVSCLWDGQGPAWLLRGLFVVLGATIAPLVHALLRKHTSPTTALGAGVLCAAATNLILVGSGLHVELPYLVLVLVSLFDQERLRQGGTTWVAARWGALHAASTLLRAEHALTFVLLLVLLLVQRSRGFRTTAVYGCLAFVLVLLPWHWVAWRQVDTYNHDGAPALPPAGHRAPGMLPWDEAALARLRTLPAFQQAPTFGFVSDTVRVRGGTEVRAADLDVLQQAYGTWPAPLGRPFVCLYGGLNFFLGNSPEANGGFSQRALDRRPPLVGGPQRYPPGLLQVLPRNGQLSLGYPPHLDLLVHGYRRGIDEIATDPRGAAARFGTKLWYGLEGATGGVGGYGLPIGLSGVRRPVDLVTADGWWAGAWRILVAVTAAAGLWTLRRQAWLQAWLVFAATKAAVVGAFFGYARQGALCAPLVAIGIAAAAERCLLGSLRAPVRRAAFGALLLVLLLLELVRCLGTSAALDDFTISPGALGPIDHEAHAVRYR
jgi:hypothetical protein